MRKTRESCVSFASKMEHLMREINDTLVQPVDPKEFQDIEKLVAANLVPKIMPGNSFKNSAQLELPPEMFKVILEKDRNHRKQNLAKMVNTKLQKPVTRT